MERVIAQAEELHHHTVVQSNSIMRRSNFSRRRSYSGNGSVPAGVKDTNPLRRSYCVATNGSREGATESGRLQGKNQAASSSHATQEALLDSGATLSEWMDDEGEMGEQPSTQEPGAGAMRDQLLECAASQNSEDVLQDPEACLTFRIGSDGVPISDSDCESLLIGSPVRGGVAQQYGTPQRKGPSTVASPLSRGYPVKISGNTFCASEQPSQSLAASLSSLTSMRRHAAPQRVLLEAHAVSEQTEGITIVDEELGDTGDSGESGASEGDKFLTPEDSTHGSASVASHAETAASHVSTNASMPPHQHAVTQPVPLSSDNTTELLGADLSDTSAVADVVRFLASASSPDASRHAGSASTHVAAGEKSAQQQDIGTQAKDRQKLAEKGAGKQDAAMGSSLDMASGTSKSSVVPGHQTGNEAAEGSTWVSTDAADVKGCARVPQSNGGGVVSAGQADDLEAASEELGDRRRSALQKLKGRLRTRQQNAVSRSREKLFDALDTMAVPVARLSSAADEGPQPWPSQHTRSPLKSISRPCTPGDGEGPSRIPRPSSASPSQHGSPRIQAMIPSRLPRPPTPGTPGRRAPATPLCGGVVQTACPHTPRSSGRIPSICGQASASADSQRDLQRPASPAAASGGTGHPGALQPSATRARPGSARLDFRLAEDGAVSFLGRHHGDTGSHRPAPDAKLDGLSSGSSADTSAVIKGSRSSGCTSSGSALTVAQEDSSRNSGRSRTGSTTTNSSGASALGASAARPASPRSVSSKLGSRAGAAACRARGMGAGGAAPARSSSSAVLARRTLTSCDDEVCAVLPARPSTSPPQASVSTSSAAVSSELRASQKHTSKSRPTYANVKPRTDSHLDLNYIPVAKGHHRSTSSASQAPAAKPAWGSQATAAKPLGSSRRTKSQPSTMDLVTDKKGGSALREAPLGAAEKLSYDALLGHVTNLLSEVRTALRQ
ncbi:g2326 [Coccomyxa elongata]